jgi:hypothetical protein
MNTGLAPKGEHECFYMISASFVFFGKGQVLEGSSTVVNDARVHISHQQEYIVFIHVFCKICFIWEYIGVTMTQEQL